MMYMRCNTKIPHFVYIEQKYGCIGNCVIIWN